MSAIVVMVLGDVVVIVVIISPSFIIVFSVFSRLFFMCSIVFWYIRLAY